MEKNTEQTPNGKPYFNRNRVPRENWKNIAQYAGMSLQHLFSQFSQLNSKFHQQYEYSPISHKMLHGFSIKDVVFEVDCTVVLTYSGHVLVAGRNDKGQLGLGHNEPIEKLVQIPNLIDIQKVAIYGSADRISYFCVNKKGDLIVFGDNQQGQLGLGHKNPITTPTKVPKLKDIWLVTIDSLRQSHLFCVNFEGEVFKFQLRLPSSGERINETPSKRPNLKGVKQIQVANNIYDYFYLTECGSVYRESRNKDENPTLITSLKHLKIKQIASTFRGCIYLADDGNVYAHGYESSGELGSGQQLKGSNTSITLAEFNATPAHISILKNIKQIITSAHHSFFLTKTGEVYSCGENIYYLLGRSDNTTTPTLIEELSDVQQIILENEVHRCSFITSNGDFLTTGKQVLDINSTQNNHAPVKVAALKKIQGFFTGYCLTVYLTEDYQPFAYGTETQQFIQGVTNENYNIPKPVTCFNQFVPEQREKLAKSCNLDTLVSLARDNHSAYSSICAKIFFEKLSEVGNNFTKLKWLEQIKHVKCYKATSIKILTDKFDINFILSILFNNVQPHYINTYAQAFFIKLVKMDSSANKKYRQIVKDKPWYQSAATAFLEQLKSINKSDATLEQKHQQALSAAKHYLPLIINIQEGLVLNELANALVNKDQSCSCAFLLRKNIGNKGISKALTIIFSKIKILLPQLKSSAQNNETQLTDKEKKIYQKIMKTKHEETIFTWMSSVLQSGNEKGNDTDSLNTTSSPNDYSK